MTQELIYTSAPRGLKPGTRGFCTVVSTQQMSPPLAERLESLSGYRHVFAAHDAQAGLNPVIHSHLILTIAGRKHHVLSRVADAGLDYTQRSNKFAHHVVLDATELPPGGPAWLLSQPGFMQAEWDGEPKLLATGRRPPTGFAPPAVCRNWQELTGDAGWAGVLAETAVGSSPRAACLLFRPGQDLLPLVSEALALLPVQQRWNVTFSTWFTKLPPGVDCHWRFLLADSPEAKLARRQQQALFIDLTAPLPDAGSSAMVQAARTGVVTAVAQPLTLPPLVAAAAHQKQESVTAASYAPQSVGGLAEYGLGPPPISESPRTMLRASPREKRTKLKAALIAGSVAALVLLMVGGAAVHVLRARNNANRTQPSQHARTVANAEKSTNVAAPKPNSDTNGTQAASVGQANNDQPNNESGSARGSSSSATTNDTATIKGNGANDMSTSVAAPTIDVPKDLTTSGATEPSASVAAPKAKEEPAQVDLAGHEDTPLHAAGKPSASEAHDGLTRLELMPQNSASSNARPVAIELTKAVITDTSFCKLELLGCDKFFEDKVSVDKGIERGHAFWQVGRKPEGSIGNALKLGRFFLNGESLFFEWQNSDLRLRNCLLSLNTDGTSKTVYALRRPMELSPAALSFDKASHDIEIPLDDTADAIKQDLLRLRVEADGIAIQPSDPVPLSKDVLLTIPFQPKGDAGQQVKRDVEVRIRLAKTGAKLQLHLANAGHQAELKLHSGKWETHRRPLSTGDVASWIEGIDEKLRTLNKRLEEAEKDLEKIPQAPVDPKKVDPHKDERDDANKRKMDATKRIQECSQERNRCEELIELLNTLHGTIHFTVFYPVETYEVILAKTTRD